MSTHRLAAAKPLGNKDLSPRHTSPTHYPTSQPSPGAAATTTPEEAARLSIQRVRIAVTNDEPVEQAEE
jgi:hypothetical protein